MIHSLKSNPRRYYRKKARLALRDRRFYLRGGFYRTAVACLADAREYLEASRKADR